MIFGIPKIKTESGTSGIIRDDKRAGAVRMQSLQFPALVASTAYGSAGEKRTDHVTAGAGTCGQKRCCHMCARRFHPIEFSPSVLERLENRQLLSTTFIRTNLVSDMPGVAKLTDPNLVNPWGIAIGLNNGLVVSDN